MATMAVMRHGLHQGAGHFLAPGIFSRASAGSSLPPALAGGVAGLNFRGLSALERGFSMQALAMTRRQCHGAPGIAGAHGRMTPKKRRRALRHPCLKLFYFVNSGTERLSSMTAAQGRSCSSA
jgi:hypothetical protein